MKNYRVFLIVAFMFLGMLSFAASSAQSNLSVTGTITFNGAIVESPCNSTLVNQTITTSCYYNGETLTHKQIVSYNMPLNSNLPGDMGSSSVKWLNPQHSLGIVTVTYL